MAITRAQQAKQMLREGGMTKKIKGQEHMLAYITPGEAKTLESLGGQKTMTPEGIPAYPPPGEKGGAGYVGPSSYTAADDRREQQRGNQYSKSTTKKSTFDSEIHDQTTDDDRKQVTLTGGDVGSGLETKREENIKKLKTFQDTRPDVKTPPLGVLSFLKTPFQKFSDFTTARNRKFFEDVIRAGKIPGVSFADLSNPNFNLEQEYQDYMSNRLAGKTDAYGNPTAGFSYDSEGNLVGNFRDDDRPLIATNLNPFEDTDTDTETETETEDDDFQRFFRLMADGGSVDDMEREAMFLGGITKGIKKAVRGVKKIAKSPIGKLAIGALLFKGVGGAKGLASLFGKGSFNPLKQLVASEGFEGLGPSNLALKLAKFGLVDPSKMALTGLGKFAAVGVPAALAGVMTDKQKDQTFKQPDYPDFNMQAYLNDPYKYTTTRQMADGGIMRAGYQEGSKEPVAKKTMPLLDMDGKEMDFREEGGFVPIGRMEKADDVPARLSKNEFVFTADAVRNAGDGDVDKGAEVMYNMMKNLESGGDVSEESQGLEGARKMFQTSKRLEEVL